MKPLSVVLAIFITVSFIPSVFAQSAAFDTALKQAKEENKGVAIYFHADGFNAPETLQEFMPDDWVVNTFLERKYIAISVDADTEEGEKLARRYPSLGMYPVLALVDSSNEELTAHMIFDSGEEDADTWAHFFLRHELMVGELRGD